MISGSRDRQQKLAKRRRSINSGGAIFATALAADFTQALGTLEAHARDHFWIKTAFANAPIQFRKIAAIGQQQRRLPSMVTITPLLNTARPPPMEICHYPAASTIRPVQSEMRPGMTAPRVLDHSAKFASRIQRSSEAAAIVTLYLADTRAFDVKRLTGP